MKHLFHPIAVLWACILLASGCVSEKTDYKQDGNPSGESVGYLSLAGSGLEVVTDTEIMTSSRTQVAESALDDYTIAIDDASAQTVRSFKYGEKPADPIELVVGNYTLRAFSGSVPPAAWETPVYTGSQEFSISKSVTTSLETTVCRLSNVKVTVGYSADLAAELQEGSQTLVAIASNSLTFGREETRAGYFEAAGSEVMQIEITLVIDGRTRKMTSTVENVKAGQWRRITVNKEHSNEGKVSFSITVETLTVDEEIVVDIPGLEEEVIGNAPTIVWGDLDLEQRFQLLKSMFDPEGDFIDASGVAVASTSSTLQRFEVEVVTDNAALTQALSEAGIDATFDLCTADTALAAALAGLGLPTGVQVRVQTSVTLPTAKLMGLLYRFDGQHDLNLRVTDAADRTTEATLMLLVDKAGEAGPSEGPTIAWVGYDIDQTYEVSADLTVQIDVAAESGIAGFLVDIDSDVHTGEVLGMIGLAPRIDLINPGDMEEILGTPAPDGLGFPIKDEVSNQNYVRFDISSFMQMILDLQLPGYFNFRLTVSDNDGATTVKTIQLTVSES